MIFFASIQGNLTQEDKYKAHAEDNTYGIELNNLPHKK